MFEQVKEALVGCVYTVFTPFDEREQVDYDSLERYLRAMYDGGARSFYAMAYNSRYSQMTDSEILDLNAFVIRSLKTMDAANTVIVGDPIHCSTAVSCEFARHARDCGADLISLIVREKYFDDDQILEHFATVGRDAGLGIFVHEMPLLSGYTGTQMHWPLSLFEKLPSVPEIAALKEDAKDAETTIAALSLEPRIRVVIAGRKSSFVPFLEHRARAYLNGISMVDARIGQVFWRAVEAGDQETMRRVIDDLEAPIFDDCVAKYGWHRTNKAVLQAAGFMHRRDRMPLKHLDESAYQEVAAVYERIRPIIAEVCGS